jgi:quercetin dioxygenase-like cupin family protein
MPSSRHSARRRVLTIAAAAVCSIVVVLSWNDHSAGAQGERRVIAESRFAVTNAPLQADVVQLVVDFPPGAWTSWHTHGGQAINLVLEGEITLRHAGMERPHRAGQAWTDSTNEVHAAGNTGSEKARLLTNFLLPKGAPQITVVQESQFGPTVLYEVRFPVPTLPADTEIVQQVAELSSGWRAERESGGFVANIVVDGEVRYKIGAERKEYKAGDAWFAHAGIPVTEENGAPRAARVFTTYLLPRGTGR